MPKASPQVQAREAWAVCWVAPAGWAVYFQVPEAVHWRQVCWGCCWARKAPRKYGGQALSYGGLAALGVLAYKAYGNWQANQGKAPQTEPQTIDRVAPSR